MLTFKAIVTGGSLEGENEVKVNAEDIDQARANLELQGYTVVSIVPSMRLV